MKANIIFEGREIEIDVKENFLLELKSWISGEKKKTGYERVKQGEFYFSPTYDGKAATDNTEAGDYYDEGLYASANYHSDKTLAENNARADKLYRQLRRFAVEHREKAIDWKEETQKKFIIYFDFVSFRMMLSVATAFTQQTFGGIYFDSEETAKLAIDTFKDELMWYFTEYKDSL